MSYLEIDNQFRINVNDARYCAEAGLLYASCFGYADTTKSLIANINKKTSVFLDGSKIFIPTNAFEIYSCKVQNADYYHTIISRKDVVENDSDGDEYLFCVVYDTGEIDENKVADKIFDKLNKNSSVPILREWMPYLIEKMRSNGSIFHRTYANIGTADNDVTVRLSAFTVYSKWLVNTIQTGLKEGTITIEGCRKNSPEMENISGLDGYLENFNEILTQKIQQSFTPKFIPQVDSYDQNLVDLNDYSDYKSRFKYYPAQLSVIQAVSNTLDSQKAAFVTAEMGAGKTSIAIASVLNHNKDKKSTVNIVLCPGHLVEKWKSEIQKLAPLSDVVIVDNLKTLQKLEDRIKNNHHRHLWLVLSKDIAKLSYDERPAVVWSESQKCY